MLLPEPESPLTRIRREINLSLQALAHELLALIAFHAFGARVLVALRHAVLRLVLEAVGHERLALVTFHAGRFLVAVGHALLLRRGLLRVFLLLGVGGGREYDGGADQKRSKHRCLLS